MSSNFRQGKLKKNMQMDQHFGKCKTKWKRVETTQMRLTISISARMAKKELANFCNGQADRIRIDRTHQSPGNAAI